MLRLHAAGQRWPASHITAGLSGGAYVRTRRHASLAANVKRYKPQPLYCAETLDRFQGCLIGTNKLTCVSLEYGSKCAAILAARSILALSDILVLGSRRNLSKRCCCCLANIDADVATRDELRIQARRLLRQTSALDVSFSARTTVCENISCRTESGFCHDTTVIRLTLPHMFGSSSQCSTYG